jgi:hypothetical protein
MPIAADTVDDLIRELGADVCVAYRACFEKVGDPWLRRRGFDPRTLMVLNLELRSEGSLPPNKLYLSGDGSGNFWFASAGDPLGKVALWSHDPPGIESTEYYLLEFLQLAEQVNPIAVEAPPGYFYISRSKEPGESILDPIELDEWIRVVEHHPAIQFLGYRPARNPFTGEELRFKSPGGAFVRHNDEKIFFELRFGRVCAKDVPAELDPLIHQLASALAAKVTGRTAPNDG